MKPLVIDSTLTNMAGTFYPTGHVFALFLDEDCVRQAAAALQAAGHTGSLSYATAETILEDIVGTLGSADAPFPSVGAEGDMVRRIADLAARGHQGMLIEMRGDDDSAQVLAAIEPEGAVVAFYYRTFVIEDLIAQVSDGGAQSVHVGTRAADAKPKA